MIPVRALRLDGYDAVTLNRQAFLNGEIFYDSVNNTLRLFDGKTTGGRFLATQTWTSANFASLTALTSNNTAINTAIALKAPIASPTFTGTVTGTFSGNITGNVTGDLTGDIYTASGLRVLDNGTNYANPVFIGDIYASDATTMVLNNGTNGTDATFSGNSATATKLTTARNINGVAFDGSANITVTADASTLSGGTLKSTVLSSSLTSVGTLTNLAVTGNITAGSNVVISTTPTQLTHATNKQYVDTRALALSVAMS
jgi:hypothetical protein